MVTQSSLFVGAHDHTIDGKGRLILPSAFRSQLEAGAYITALDSCLGILPVEEFADTAEQLRSQVGSSEVDLNALRSFAARADFVVPDNQGRMRILSHLRAAGGLERRVVVIGMIRRIEVWNPDRWREVQSVGTESLADAITHGRGIGGA
ncbi:MAG: hypothetical protein OXE79_07980 [Acidimicrobiaceae bacterium]|nr:hypothetical protein [Acidimicrobiaceae bacterium]MCY4175763.1 hypothetical protein [Acidimicrobiaceae bacterium]MCY4280864.1 hypothetical protein [Acidimicrobiaceae bacterium]MCY4294581.1 hypothetical protein [Acidimicrobiaceae bacterium]